MASGKNPPPDEEEDEDDDRLNADVDPLEFLRRALQVDPSADPSTSDEDRPSDDATTDQ